MIPLGIRTMKFLARPVIAPTKVTPAKICHLLLPAGPKKLLSQNPASLSRSTSVSASCLKVHTVIYEHTVRV